MNAGFNDGESIPLEPGEKIRLQCNFRGNPRPNIAWYKNEKKIFSQLGNENQTRRHIRIRKKR